MMARYYSEAEVLARLGGVTLARLRAWVEADCVAPVRGEAGPLYAEADLARLALAAELAETYELDAEALALVLSLVERMHALHNDLARLAAALAEEEGAVRDRIRARLSRAA